MPSSDELRRSQLDEAALASLELGTPDGIRAAVSRISYSAGMSDLNRLILFLAAELMAVLYPLDRVTWDVPSVPDQDTYARIIRAAKQGIADFSGGEGFFPLVLPALALFYATEASLPLDQMDSALARANGINPSSALPPWFRAEIAKRQGRQDDAAAFYRKAWALGGGGCYPAGLSYADSLIRAGDARSCLDIARAVLARYPSSLEAMRLCAESYAALGEWSNAEPYITSGLRADPSNADLLLLRARLLVERKEYLSASALLDSIAASSRTSKDYLLLKARIGREWNRNTASAAFYLQDALRLYPDDEAVQLAAAQVCYESGMTLNGKTGRDLVLQALERNPYNGEALSLLVADYISAFEWEAAVATAELFAASAPGDRSSLLLARAYSGSGQTGRALSIMRGLYSDNPSDEEIADIYLEALIDSGDSAQARRIIDSMMPNASPSMQSRLYYHLSRLQTDPAQELSALRSSLLTDPRNSSALFAMYAWYFRMGDYRRAQYYLKQVAAINPQNREYARLLSELEGM